jgi:single-stranded-DNA-specific exonuclease
MEKQHENFSVNSIEIVRRPFLSYSNNTDTQKLLAKLDPIIQSILLNRGIKQDQDCESDLAHLIPFTLLKDIDVACELIYESLIAKESILIIGDFDADGATSTAIAIKGLRSLGFENLTYLVPDRFKFGYGLSPEIVQVAIANQEQGKPDLIITVDNGISSIEGVALARENGIKVLITDHHLPGKQKPDANAIVNPNQIGCEFPSKNLAGVGVMFYLLIAFRAFLRERNYFLEKHLAEPNLAVLLDIVALGTVADLVALDHNNRRLVQQGLSRIRAGLACEGIQALIEVAKKNPSSFKSTDLGFALGPRINAAGRLDSMSAGIECLLADNAVEAKCLAEQLNDFNEDRKQIEGAMKKEALALLPELAPNKSDKPVICLFDDRWHQGVVGIVASRLKELYHLPSVIFAQDDNDLAMLKGSARSVPGLHMRDLLDRVASKYPSILKKFGGHAMAAGMSIYKEDFVSFSESLCEETLKVLSEQADDILQAKTFVDAELSNDHFNLDFAKQLLSFEPWGQRFPEPLFIGEFKIDRQRVLSEKHLKLWLQHAGLDYPLDAIAFNVDRDLWAYEGKKVTLIYKLDINEFRGLQTLQLMVEKIIPLETL